MVRNLTGKDKMETKKSPLHINQILKLPVTKFGKKGDLIFMYNDFVIFLKDKDRPVIRLNEFIKIRITKILPKFALAVLVSENINKTKVNKIDDFDAIFYASAENVHNTNLEGENYK